ncbi:MAG TPA: tetratricopeptide repeat protein [Candidatus Acidoferrum sp.]|nr:tetratricopeptide repeat protein [Candidatus Acidoferrum sp.]
MPSVVKVDPRRDYVRRVLPWLLGAAMLAVYLVTLNSWVSFLNLRTVTKVSGWLWVPDLESPLYHLVTLPFHLLPAVAVPVVLNLFSAGCAAVALGLLARSVALLPHDRTEAQLVRERNEFGLLTLRSAWLPPLLAVLLCGLQLTFWELATNGDSEMFDLLLFAFVVWSLLEYRLDGREKRLFWSAVVVGAGIAEGPSMAGFFPLFIVAVIWARGLNIFNIQFLTRMTFCGLAGISLFLLFPVMATISGNAPETFWGGLKFSLQPQYQTLKLYFLCVANLGSYFEALLMPLFISLMPLLVMSIRWKIGDSSRFGSALAAITFHTIHAIFLGVCVWLVFDPPFSPRAKGLGLTLYYLIALSLGYYVGYFLLVFGKKHPRAGEFPPLLARLFNTAVITGVWLLAILAVAGLVYKNAMPLRTINGNEIHQYASLVTENLPPAGAIVMSDDPTRLYLTKAELVREGRANNYLMLDTGSLPIPQYHRYLHKKWPQKWPLLVSPSQKGKLNPIGLAAMLAMLGQSNELCYLHPSFGDYFERFYLEPHGLIYRLKTLPRDTLLPVPPDKDLLAENEAFWTAAQEKELASVENAITPPSPNAPETFIQRALVWLDVPREPDMNAAVLGIYCSRSLDFWGVELECSGDLTNAAMAFQTALALNTNNIAAQINLDFNGTLREGQRPVVDPSHVSLDRLGKFDSLFAVIRQCGPLDDPSFCFAYALALSQSGNFRQAVAPFARVCELAPDYWPAHELLGRIYALNRLPDRALAVLHAPLKRPEDFSLNPANVTDLHMLVAASYFQKNDLDAGSRMLETEISHNPTNDDLAMAIQQIYANRGMYSNALAVVDRRLDVSPGDPRWLYAKGSIFLLQKKYDEAIMTLNKVLTVQTDNNQALYELGTAYLGSSNLDEAHTDFAKIQESDTNSYQVAYQLGEIAWRQHDTNEELRNYQIYLSNAPTNTAEAQTVRERLQELGPSAQ